MRSAAGVGLAGAGIVPQIDTPLLLDILLGLVILLFVPFGIRRGVAKEAMVSAGVLLGATLAERFGAKMTVTGALVSQADGLTAETSLAGLDPEEEVPILYLRLRKAWRKGGLRVFSIAPLASSGLAKLGGDDGRMTISAVLGTFDRPTDIAPNSGVILARPASALVAGLLVLAPELLELDCLDVRLHAPT